MALIVVEIGDHAAPAALSAALVQACSSSFAPGSCALEESGEESPVAIATVKWGDAGERSVQIEVGTKQRGEARWLSKTLRFRAVDPRAERWRSAGLTIATLVRELIPASESTREGAPGPSTTGAREDGDAAATEPRAEGATADPEATGRSTPDAPAATRERPSIKETPADEPPPRAAPAPRRSPRRTLWVDLGPRGGRAFRGGGVRAGGFVAIGFYPSAVPVLARLALGHEIAISGPADLSAALTSATLGGGAALRLRDTALVLEPHAAFVLERLGVSLSDDTGRSDDASQWGAGAEAGAALIWERAWVAPLLGADLLWRGQPIDIAETNRVRATLPAVDWSVRAAVRMFL